MAVEFFTLPHSSYSLGLVSDYLSIQAPFRHYEFGTMIETLRYQLGHGTHLVLGTNDKITGYAGWIRTTRDIARSWVLHDTPLRASWDNVDAVVLTVVVVDDPKHYLALIRRFKAVNPNCDGYWKRQFQSDRPASRRGIIKKNEI